MNELKNLVDLENNLIHIRNLAKAAQPPFIPYPGVYHKDLLSLKALGEIVVLENDVKWINADRINRTTAVINATLKNQKLEYKFNPLSQFTAYMTKHPQISSHDMDQISLNLEPE